MKIGISTQFSSKNQPKRESISKGMKEWHKQNKYKDALYKALVRENLIEKMIEQLVLSLADKKMKPKDKAIIIIKIMKLLSPINNTESGQIPDGVQVVSDLSTIDTSITPKNQ